MRLNNKEVHEAESEEHHQLYMIIATGEPNKISFEEGYIIIDIDFVSEDWWQGTEEKFINYFLELSRSYQNGQALRL
ncbi:hypothetical protein Glove_139g194 [Diversispora epigaea]|uniref:Uncharacterized protein n=1 Tax=Diversispora epigaea TaxID=1348612 RepID=A0A397IVD4_9GLOM|nr:hypothetical protein Glove_139g194 [Diversispora epigaea]